MSVDGTASSEAIISAVRAAGYDASEKGSDTKGSVQSGEDTLEDHETPKLKRRLIASLIFLVILMYISMGHMMWNWPLPSFMADNHIAMGLIQLLLTIAIMVD